MKQTHSAVNNSGVAQRRGALSRDGIAMNKVQSLPAGPRASERDRWQALGGMGEGSLDRPPIVSFGLTPAL
jgi:hypothetical protein